MPFEDLFRNLDMKSIERRETDSTLGDGFTLPSKAKGAFMSKVANWRDQVITDYNVRGVDLNEGISKIAEDNDLNFDQISRLIEEVNCEVYLDMYNAVKDSSVRDVRFKIASMQTVKDLMSPEEGAKVEESYTDPRTKGKAKKGPSKGITKRAFTESEGEPMTFLNSTSSVFSSLMTEAEKELDPNHFLIQKTARAICELESSIEKEAKEIEELYQNIGSELVKFARYEGEAQEAFDLACKINKTPIAIQHGIIDMFREKVASFKDLGYLPPSGEFNLEHVVNYDYNDFSLGNDSFIKVAKERKNKDQVSAKKLIGLINTIAKKQDTLIQKQDKLNKVR